MPESQEAQFERYRAYLHLMARRAIATSAGRKVDESDVVQEVLYEAIRMKEQYRGDSSGQYLAWLRKILSRKICDAHRHFSRKKRDASRDRSIHESVEHSSQCLERSLCVTESSPSVKVERKEDILVISEAIRQMATRQQTAIELHYFEGMSFSEVAEEMGLTRNQVAGLIRRALLKLRQVRLNAGGDISEAT